MVKDREGWHAAVHGVAKNWTQFINWTTTTTSMSQENLVLRKRKNNAQKGSLRKRKNNAQDGAWKEAPDDSLRFLKRWEYQTTLPASWEICMQVRKQWLELDMEQQTGPKLGKEYVKSVYYHPAYLTYMHRTSWEMLGWMKHKLESRLVGEI